MDISCQKSVFSGDNVPVSLGKVTAWPNHHQQRQCRRQSCVRETEALGATDQDKMLQIPICSILLYHTLGTVTAHEGSFVLSCLVWLLLYCKY